MHAKRRSALSILMTVLMLIVLALAVSVIFHIEKKIEEKRYPIKYYEEVAGLSREYGVPKNIIFAVILTESNFDPDALSKTGARGLMQIMPDTFADLQDRLGDEYDSNMLYDPEINMRYGTYYLSYLYDIFGDWEITFAAYNGGMGNVRKWLSDSRYSRDGKLVNIPFAETKAYVSKVSAAAEKYKEIINATEEEK